MGCSGNSSALVVMEREGEGGGERVREGEGEGERVRKCSGGTIASSRSKSLLYFMLQICYPISSCQGSAISMTTRKPKTPFIMTPSPRS